MQQQARVTTATLLRVAQAPRSLSVRTALKWFLWFLMVFFSVGVAHMSSRFILQGDFHGWMHHLEARPLATYIHFGLGPIALLSGGFQFLHGVRRRFPRVHRWLGWIYAVACVAAGLGSLSLASATTAGPVAGLGFTVLACLWIYTTVRAVWTARRKDFAAHRKWMIRSYALTFSAATLRLYSLIFAVILDWEYADVYLASSWACWLINLLVAEVWIIPKGRPARLQSI